MAKRVFDEDTIALLKRDNADARPLSDSEPQHGWAGGLHELDTEFSCEKNLRGRYVSWAFRVTEDKPPPGRIKALAEMEMVAAEKDGRKLPWSEAKEIALEAVTEEGKDGRYTRHTVIPVVWDGEDGEVWYGAASEKWVTLFTALFAGTFGVELEQVTASTFHNDNAMPPDMNPVWMEPDSDDWLGNDLMMWLLARDRVGEHVVAGATVAVMNRVELACPAGEKGRDVVTTTCPAKSPEVTTAVRDGRVARKVGLIVVTPGGTQYEFTLAAERWAVTGAKVPDNEDLDGMEADVARLDACRELFTTMDAVMSEFVAGHEEHNKLVREWTAGGE